MSHRDNPRHCTKASKRPLPTQARPSAALPMERVTRTALRTASSSAKLEPGSRLNGLRVLVVEDEPRVSEALHLLLGGADLLI